MDVIKTPPIELSPVTDTIATWQWLDGQDPVDFLSTGGSGSWSAEFLIENCGKVEFRVLATLDSEGYITVMIPQSTGAELRSMKRIDAKYQLRFTAPLPDMDEVWQGPVVVLEVIE